MVVLARRGGIEDEDFNVQGGFWPVLVGDFVVRRQAPCGGFSRGSGARLGGLVGS